ncbi:hypothetical protein [Haloactinomyces albus]|uniref:hypothetical protein n=1 Tax=Haloactinomyces albus TaxID=1352928 RepID=UPI002869EF30|nr:hypothetical protein [Haloactinomyces albus]
MDHPDELVRSALYPVIGEKTLRELVKETKANERAFQARVRTVLRSSYSNHYRRMLPALMAALEFRCNNTAYRPIMQALDLLQSYADAVGSTTRARRCPSRVCGAESLAESCRRREGPR